MTGRMKPKAMSRRGSFMPYGAPFAGAPRLPGSGAPLMPLGGSPSPTALPLAAAGGPPEFGFRPPAFDLYLVDDVFSLPVDETALAEQLLRRHDQLLPTASEQSAIQGLVGQITKVLNAILAAPDSFTAVAIEEICEVGSYKKGTMLTQHNVADLLLVLKTLPTMESVNALGQKIVSDLKEEHKEVFGCVTRDFGCEIAGTQAVVRILVTIVPQNAHLLEPDLHLSEKILQQNMAALRHVRWFDEHAVHSSVRVLVRLLKDVQARFAGLQPLSAWTVELLSHYCIIHTRTRVPLPLTAAFKRFFHVLSTGMLLPTSPALVDPCDPLTRLNYALSYEEMDSVCSTAQTLYRVIVHGGTEQVLGLSQTPANVATELTVWNDVVVTPLEKAYTADDMEPYYAPPSADTVTASA